jgi:hypothetical protein
MAAVMIGVDPHKASHTAVAISAAEELLGELRVRACAAQAERLLAWAAAWPQLTWALRVALLDYLAMFAQACQLEIPDEDLIRDAYPAGRGEADLQRIYRASRDCDWRLDPDPATRAQPPPAVMAAVNDKEYQRAMRARSLIACRRAA